MTPFPTVEEIQHPLAVSLSRYLQGVKNTPGGVGFLPSTVSVSTGLKPNSLKSQTVDNLEPSVEVVCGDADHGAMLLFAVLGVLFYPVAIWVALLAITWKYPVWLCSGKGIETGLKPWLCWISGNGKPPKLQFLTPLKNTNNLFVMNRGDPSKVSCDFWSI